MDFDRFKFFEKNGLKQILIYCLVPKCKFNRLKWQQP